MNTLTTCKAVGHLFFILATLVEIILFCSIFNLDENSIGRMIATIVTAVIFNGAIWLFSQLYYKTKHRLETNTEE
jgi:hypothetical protein